MTHLRFDLKVIASWIEPNSKVLDLGCGEGELLFYLKKYKNITGLGIDNIETNISTCIEKGLSVIQGDINDEVVDYPKKSFDYVILSQTLQQVYSPSELIHTLLQVGKRVIVSFPNFSHWSIRFQLLLTGYAPVTSQLPFQWYNTPNIRVITLNDFRKFAREKEFQIIKEVAINTKHRDKSGSIIRVFPSFLATYGIFLIGR